MSSNRNRKGHIRYYQTKQKNARSSRPLRRGGVLLGGGAGLGLGAAAGVGEGRGAGREVGAVPGWAREARSTTDNRPLVLFTGALPRFVIL